jgi:hypothetical protein
MIVDVRELTPELALIFRLTHVDNLPWTVTNGVHCRTSEVQDPDFVEIGNTDLIQRRPAKLVPIAPYGTLADYVPFYFTPCSPMLHNIRTGWNNLTRRPPSELVFLVASLRSLAAHGVPFVFSDRHAFLTIATFSTSLDDLDGLGWRYWQQRDFRRDPDDPEKLERYQAEALVRHHLPVERMDAIVCSGESEQACVAQMAHDCGYEIEVVCRRHWFL